MFLNKDCLMPGQNGETVSRKGKVLERSEFETMKDEYYLFRGWDVDSGYPVRSKLRDLDLGDVAESLQVKGLLKKD